MGRTVFHVSQLVPHLVPRCSTSCSTSLGAEKHFKIKELNHLVPRVPRVPRLFANFFFKNFVPHSPTPPYPLPTLYIIYILINIYIYGSYGTRCSNFSIGGRPACSTSLKKDVEQRGTNWDLWNKLGAFLICDASAPIIQTQKSRHGGAGGGYTADSYALSGIGLFDPHVNRS